jgi:hypothetical protein
LQKQDVNKKNKDRPNHKNCTATSYKGVLDFLNT